MIASPYNVIFCWLESCLARSLQAHSLYPGCQRSSRSPAARSFRASSASRLSILSPPTRKKHPLAPGKLAPVPSRFCNGLFSSDLESCFQDGGYVCFFTYSLLCKVRICSVTVEIMKSSALILVITLFSNYFVWLADGGKLRDFLNCSVNLTFIYWLYYAQSCSFLIKQGTHQGWVVRKPVNVNPGAKLQNAGPLIYISLNHKGPYCVMLRSWKDFDTCKTGGPKWPCIL